MKSFRPFVFLLIFAFSCQRVSKNEADKAASATASPAAPQAPPAGAPPAAMPSSPNKSSSRLYAVVNFPALRKLQILQTHADQMRTAAARQGVLGKLISCGADPFSSLERVQAVLPSDFRRSLQGSVIAEGTFDAARVRACLATEFQKENYRHEARKDADVFSHPRMTFEVSSPKPGHLQAVSPNWTEIELPPEMAELFAELGPGHALYLGSRGAIMPKHPELSALALAFSPSQDALAVQSRLHFTREDVAAALHAAVSAQLGNRRQALAVSADPRMQMAARVLEKLSITREKNRISISASIPYTDVGPLLSLFNFKIQKTF